MKNRAGHHLAKPLGLAAGLVFVILLPLLARGYWLHILILLIIDVILVVSFRLITTMGGWSFAHIVLMGVGGYTSALLTTQYLHWSFWLTLPLGGLVTALVAFAISFPCLRTKGFYFFLSTFAAGEAIRQTWINFAFFGGRFGVPHIIHPNPILGLNFVEMLPNYYLVLAIALLSVFVLYRLDKSRISSTIGAIYSSEELSESIGINTWGYKAMAFVTGSFFAGIAGVLFAHYNGIVDPHAVTIIYMYKIVTAAIIGGTGSFVGPIIGLVVVTTVTEIFRELHEWVPFIYGIVIIVILLFLPEGLQSLPRQISRRFEKVQIGRGMMRHVTGKRNS